MTYVIVDPKILLSKSDFQSLIMDFGAEAWDFKRNFGPWRGLSIGLLASPGNAGYDADDLGLYVDFKAFHDDDTQQNELLCSLGGTDSGLYIIMSSDRYERYLSTLSEDDAIDTLHRVTRAGVTYITKGCLTFSHLTTEQFKNKC